MRKDVEKILLKVEKPGRYTGGELNEIIKNPEDTEVRFAFCFPDVYEIGMSHLGMKILYSALNSQDYVWCERVFAPWPDMENIMREKNIPLYGLESSDAITNFDFIGFTLQYELSYTNILNMLDLANIPLLSSQRKNLNQIVVAGGPCAFNPEPLADFVDIFSIGEGEETLLELTSLYRECKKQNKSKDEFLKEATKIKGMYVPKFYSVTYNDDGTVRKIENEEFAPAVIEKSIVDNVNTSYFPQDFVVPSIEIVHNRAVAEVLRGCIRGCRFCQAGFIYRPFREKNVETVYKQSWDLCVNTGYRELSLSSLSSTDHSEIENMLDKLSFLAYDKNVNISLPSLRVDGFSGKILDNVKQMHKNSLTFAPEAGSQRLRDVINKNVTEDDIIETCRTVFENGFSNIKLYFMLGLPTETDDDVKAIANLAQRVVDEYYEISSRPKCRPVKVTISVAAFVPKAFTPFQWEAQDTIENFRRKQYLLKDEIKSKRINYNYHEADTSFLEAVFARGDRRLSKVLLKAHEEGMKFDSWFEYFSLTKWMKIFESFGLDPSFYANRKRNTDEVLPWDHISCSVKKDFFIAEKEKAYKTQTTNNCKKECTKCGAFSFKRGICVEKKG